MASSAFRLSDPTKPHKHNCIPIAKGVIRKRRVFICIHCDGEFDQDPDPITWEQQCDIDREDAIAFENEVYATRLREHLDWDEHQIDQNEHGYWWGCRSIYVIQEEP